MTKYTTEQIDAAIDADAQAWARFYKIDDPNELEVRRHVQRANIACNYFSPELLPFLPKFVSDRSIIGSCCNPDDAIQHVIAFSAAQQDEHEWARDHFCFIDAMERRDSEQDAIYEREWQDYRDQEDDYYNRYA